MPKFMRFIVEAHDQFILLSLKQCQHKPDFKVKTAPSSPQT